MNLTQTLIAAANTVETFQLEHVPFWGTYTIIIFVVAIVLFCLGLLVSVIESDIELFFAGLISAAVAFLVFGVIPSGIGVSSALAEQKEQGLENLGYTQVAISGDQFTAANSDGKYIKGVLHTEDFTVYYVLTF